MKANISQDYYTIKSIDELIEKEKNRVDTQFLQKSVFKQINEKSTGELDDIKDHIVQHSNKIESMKKHIIPIRFQSKANRYNFPSIN